MLPPGRARLPTRPASTGSFPGPPITMGIVRKARRIGTARANSVAGSPVDRYPIRGIFFGCCAWAGKLRAKSKAPSASPISFMLPVLSCLMLVYRITLSALASTFGEIVSPKALAVLRLITNSNFMGCSTGSSAGLAPLRILSAYVAARRNKSGKYVP
jgi:hypothetical protein